MKTIFDHIETVKAKPHHVRRRIAFAAAAAGAGLVAIVWFLGVFATGTFAIAGTNFAESTGAESNSAVAAAPSESSSGLAGAAAAVAGSSQAPVIEIVDGSSGTAAPQQPEPTTIPF